MSKPTSKRIPDRAPWKAVPVGLYETRSGERLV